MLTTISFVSSHQPQEKKTGGPTTSLRQEINFLLIKNENTFNYYLKIKKGGE